ncbi:hypothetical protein [Candidatus Nitrospira bockiana]
MCGTKVAQHGILREEIAKERALVQGFGPLMDIDILVMGRTGKPALNRVKGYRLTLPGWESVELWLHRPEVTDPVTGHYHQDIFCWNITLAETGHIMAGPEATIESVIQSFYARAGSRFEESERFSKALERGRLQRAGAELEA